MDRLVWWKRAWNVAYLQLVYWRLANCYMCDNKGSDNGQSCSCGACGVVYQGSRGYSWCSSIVGCIQCGRS